MLLWRHPSIISCPVILEISDSHLWAEWRLEVQDYGWLWNIGTKDGSECRDASKGGRLERAGTGKIPRSQWSRKKQETGKKWETWDTHMTSELGSELKPLGPLGDPYEWMSMMFIESLRVQRDMRWQGKRVVKMDNLHGTRRLWIGKSRERLESGVRIFIETQEQRQQLKSDPEFADTGRHPEENLTCGQPSPTQ